MKFNLNPKSHILPMIVLASLFTNMAQAAPLNLYNKEGRLFSDQDLERIQAKTNEPLLIDSSLAKGANPKYFSVTLSTFTGLNSYSPEMIDITKSYLGVVLGNTRYNEFLSDFKEATTQNTVVQLSLRLSLVPLILSGSVRDSAISVIGAKAEQARAQYTAAAAVSIHQQVQAMVNAGKLTGPLAELMEAKFIGSAKLQIDSQVDTAKSRSITKIENRITKIEEEATFQEFAIRFGQKLFQNEKGALLVFGEIGKAPIEGNLSSATGLNSMTPMAWWAPRGLSVQGTGEVKLGLEWITTTNIKVGFEAYFFHDRAPVISGQRFMTNLIYASDASFEKQSEFWKINSDMEKFYVKIPSKFAKVEDQFYVTTASFDGKRGVGAGGIVRILPQVSIQVDSNFDRPQFDYAISEAITYHATERLSFYLVNENISNLKSKYDQDKSGQLADLSSAGVGITYRIVDMLLVGIHATIDLNAECRDFYERDNSSIQDGMGCGGGIMVNAKY